MLKRLTHYVLCHVLEVRRYVRITRYFRETQQAVTRCSKCGMVVDVFPKYIP